MKCKGLQGLCPFDAGSPSWLCSDCEARTARDKHLRLAAKKPPTCGVGECDIALRGGGRWHYGPCRWSFASVASV